MRNKIKTVDFLAIINENLAGRIVLDKAKSIMADVHGSAHEASEAIDIEGFGMKYSSWFLEAAEMRGHMIRCFHLTVDGFKKYENRKYQTVGRWMAPPAYKVVEGCEHEYLEGVILKAKSKYYEGQIAQSISMIKNQESELENAKKRLINENKEAARIKSQLEKI